MGISRGLSARTLLLSAIVLLGLWSRQISANISINPIPKTPVVGENVLLSVYSDTVNIFTFSWYRDKNLMITYVPTANPPENIFPPYKGRLRGFPNGSMEILELNTNDSGLYIVEIQAIGQQILKANVTIIVYNVLTPPTLKIPLEFIAEGIDMQLECQVGSQNVDTYIFIKDAENISCAQTNQTNISCSDSSPFLNFHSIRKSDSGNYSCTIVNLISNSTSRPQELRVLVKISNVTISSNVTSAYLWASEDSINLMCIAQGDEPKFSWSYNGTSLSPDPRYHLSISNESLTISPLTRSDVAAFTCTANNSVSQENSTPINLTISWRPDGRIQCGVDLLEEEVRLQCSWPGGSPAADVQLQFQSINGTQQNEVTRNVSKDKVTVGDRLTCHGSQIDKMDKCYFDFVVPQAPTLLNGSMTSVKEGENVVLKVILGISSSNATKSLSAMILPAKFTWINQTQSIIQPNGRFEINSDNYSSRLQISQVIQGDQGEYVCEVTNLVGKTIFSFIVNITETGIGPSIENPGGLSSGAVAGIVIGVLVGLALIGLAVYLILREKKKTSNGANTVRSQAASHQPEGSNSMHLDKQGQVMGQTQSGHKLQITSQKTPL
uniref:Carcinoembryonic antigen-related cell adhesion molecule 5-like isoform X2 n=1 Tax=Geotrypetes seraphini TaxID=260995 RepID=A0A6P8SUZ2_GEOSA|nr:carcinoembryonic antigen-related cell adhesion molecule 5-like isoform X2 [Geotrypetes seraphini]